MINGELEAGSPPVSIAAEEARRQAETILQENPMLPSSGMGTCT